MQYLLILFIIAGCVYHRPDTAQLTERYKGKTIESMSISFNNKVVIKFTDKTRLHLEGHDALYVFPDPSEKPFE